MTINRGLWVPINGTAGTTPVEARLADAGLFESNNGVDARSGILTPAGSVVVTGNPAGANLSYNVAALTAVVARTSGEGCYRFSATGTTVVTTLAAPVSGSRIDVIWVKQNDQSKGDLDNLAVVGVESGAASSTPSAPTVPAGAVALAQAVITSTTTATNTASITQVFRHAALRGAAIPVRNTTERAEITAPRLDQRVDRLDAGHRERWNGTRWAKENLTELGRASAGLGGTLVASPAWSDLLVVTATSSGGQVVVDYDVVLVNGNSGAHRSAAVRVICDSAEVDAYAFTAPYIAGVQVPVFPSLQVAHTPSAASHTWKVQAQAGIGEANSIIMLKGSMSVTEKP